MASISPKAGDIKKSESILILFWYSLQELLADLTRVLNYWISMLNSNISFSIFSACFHIIFSFLILIFRFLNVNVWTVPRRRSWFVILMSFTCFTVTTPPKAVLSSPHNSDKAVSKSVPLKSPVKVSPKATVSPKVTESSAAVKTNGVVKKMDSSPPKVVRSPSAKSITPPKTAAKTSPTKPVLSRNNSQGDNIVVPIKSESSNDLKGNSDGNELFCTCLAQACRKHDYRIIYFSSFHFWEALWLLAEWQMNQ